MRASLNCFYDFLQTVTNVNDPIVVVGMARTPLGAFLGQFSKISAPNLAAHAVRAAIAQAGVGSESIDELIMGCVLPAGVGQAPARQVCRFSGLDDSVVTMTVNKVCGSGMKSVELAAQSLILGQADFVIAGGMENMSLAPHLLARARAGLRFGPTELLDHMYTDGLEDAYERVLMGEFAERTAEKYGLSRDDQDRYAAESVTRAQRAISEGNFREEICPVELPKSGAIVNDDESPMKLNIEKIKHLKPAFRENGSVTAANASSIADGAAALLLTRQSVAESQGLEILARLDGFQSAGQTPETFTTAPITAIQKLLEKTHIDVADVDLWEINEAFAVVPMAAMQVLDIEHTKLNVNGGACALGHPLGASGARILVTLIAAMRRMEKSVGVASLCIGGGEAMAAVVRCD